MNFDAAIESMLRLSGSAVHSLRAECLQRVLSGVKFLSSMSSHHPCFDAEQIKVLTEVTKHKESLMTWITAHEKDFAMIDSNWNASSHAGRRVVKVLTTMEAHIQACWKQELSDFVNVKAAALPPRVSIEDRVPFTVVLSLSLSVSLSVSLSSLSLSCFFFVFFD